MTSSPGSIPAGSFGSAGYSASVRLFVECAGRTHKVASMGGGRFWLVTPADLDCGPARLIVEIDGEARTTPVVLQGSPDSGRTFTFVAEAVDTESDGSD